MEQFYKDVLGVIRQTRSISLPQFGNVEVSEKKNEHAISVVTEVDRGIEKYLKEELAKIDPSIEFVGEEFGGDRDAKRYWLVDPVDGTGLYVRGMSGCTTMVALIEEGHVIFGAIYDFVNDEMYSALKGGGAFKDGERIGVSDREAGNAYVAYETKMGKEENYKKYIEARSFVQPISLLCAGYTYVLIAQGKLEGRISHDPYGTDYDFAPGSLLVSEAGGVVANIGSGTYDFRNPNHIAANPTLYKQLTEGVDALFPVVE